MFNKKINKKFNGMLILGLIALMSISVRVLIQYDFETSALLYVGIPFTIAFVLTWVKLPEMEGRWKRRYFNLVITSLIIMLGSSVILFEGFLCVVMFMPIYFGVILFVFICHYLAHKYKQRRSGQLFSHIFPLLLLVSALEGTHPELSLDRHKQVVTSRIVNASVSDIHRKLVQPIELQKQRNWFLSLFPMPHQVTSGSLKEGDIHELQLKYHRWFVTNTHQGSIQLKIEKVSANEIETQFLSDTSYLSNYLKFERTRIQLIPIDDSQTQVILTISYKRLLDPAWYFDPLQTFGMEKGAEFLIAEVITPNE